MTTGALFLFVIASPFVVPAVITVLVLGHVRRRREALAARMQIGRLGE